MSDQLGGGRWQGLTIPPADKKTMNNAAFSPPPFPPQPWAPQQTSRFPTPLFHPRPPSTALGAADTFHANIIAREMILSMGMGRRMGPVDLMHTTSTAQVQRGREAGLRGSFGLG